MGASATNRTKFEEVTVSNDGSAGDTFTINGDTQDAERNEIILGIKIEGGSSTNDKLIVNTNISADNLKNKTGMENLELGLNKDINYDIDFTQLNDFKNIISGMCCTQNLRQLLSLIHI